MFSYIKGTLTYATPSFVTLESHGVGYKIFIPASLFGKLPSLESAILLHTSFVVRELSQALYGFLSQQERDLFEALMNVSGIGPKLALSIIAHLSSHDLAQAIFSHDIPTISKVPGIGKKTAERLIIEMRDKIPALISHTPSDLSIPIHSDPLAQKINDAMSALINLGYNQMIAQKAIKKTLKDFPEATDLATLITHALKHI